MSAPVIGVDLVAEALASLERVGCQFDHCDATRFVLATFDAPSQVG